MFICIFGILLFVLLFVDEGELCELEESIYVV